MITMILIIVSITVLKSQSTLLGHFSTGFNYLGFSGIGVSQPLNIRNSFPQPIIMRSPNGANPTHDWFHLQNGATFNLPGPHPTNGYIGLNQPSPRSHIDMITPAFAGGEEFFMARPDDIYAVQNVPGSGLAPNVQMGMMNLAGLNQQFLPGVYGNLNQASQDGAALQMLACIHNNRDLFALEPIMRFVVGRNWIINQNLPLPTNAANQAIANRPSLAGKMQILL